MQTKLLLLLLIAAPVFAQEATQVPQAPVPAVKTDTVPQAQTVNQEITKQSVTVVEPWNLAFVPTTISIEFGLIKENNTVDKTTWKNLKKMANELATLIKDKKLEKAALLFDSISTSQPEGVKNVITVKTSVRGERLEAHVCYTPINTQTTKTGYNYFTNICEINGANTSTEAWKEITTLVLETVKANQQFSYEQTKQLVFSIAAKG